MNREVGPKAKGIGSALTLGVLVMLLAAAEVATARAAPPLQSAETTFQAKCAACHTIGGGPLAGPDLRGVSANRSREWLAKFIATPDQLIAQGDPIARELLQQYKVPMPNMGVSMTEAEALVDYIASRSGAAAAPGSRPASAPGPQASPARGADYFSGARAFRNGGSPCIACHNASGIGALGGGVMGADLTSAYAKFGEQGLAGILAGLPFPTMKPIYDRRPLTPEEQADLSAFFKQASGAGQPAETLGWLVVMTVAGAAALLALMQVLWRGRLSGVNQPLREGKRLAAKP